MAEKKRRSRRSWGTIKKLQSGNFRPEYTHEYDGIRRVYSSAEHGAPATFSTKLDADHWLSTIRRSIELGTWTPPGTKQDHGGVTVRDHATRWLAERRLKPTTREDYGDMLRLFVYPVLGDLKLTAVTPQTVRTWYAALDTGPVRKAHTYSLLRTILGSAVDDEILPANPARIRGAGQSKSNREPVMLEPRDIQALADAMPAGLRASALILGWCGVRSGELRELRRRDIRKGATDIRVARGVTYVAGKPIVSTTKSQAGTRTIAVPPHVRPSILGHLDEYVDSGPDALLFADVDGGHLTEWKYRRQFRLAATSIGRPDLRIHDMRGVALTLAAMTGASLKEIMSRGGHSTPRAALLYQKLAAGRDAEIADRLSKMAGEE